MAPPEAEARGEEVAVLGLEGALVLLAEVVHHLQPRHHEGHELAHHAHLALGLEVRRERRPVRPRRERSA